jgi:hypothetical protein
MGRFVRSGVGIGALLLLAGCWWPVPGHDADRTGYNPDETALTPASVGDLAVRWSLQFDGPLAEGPVVSSAGVHVVERGTGATTLSTHDVDDGVTLWSQQIGPPSDGAGGPWVIGGRVAAGRYVSDPTNPSADTPSYDVATGAPRGSVGAGVIDAVRGDWVVTYQNIWGWFPGQTGTEITHYRNLADPSQSYTQAPRGDIGQTLGDDRVYVPSAGSVYTNPLGDSGAAQWETRIPGGQVSRAVLDAGETTVYVTGKQGVFALDAATGALRWSSPLVPAHNVPPSLAGDMLYVPTADGDLVALAAGGCGSAACAPLWVGPGSGSSGPVGFYRQAAVAGGLVFTAWDDGSIDSYPAAGCGAASCPALWSTTTGSTIVSSPVVAGGRLYVTTADFRLIAYGLP